MRGFLVAILGLLLSAAALGDELQSKGEFTNEAARMFRVKRPHFEVNVKGDLEIQYRAPGDAGKSPQYLYLDNAYKQYQEQPEQRREILANFLRVADSALEKHACKAEDLMPSVKDRAYLEEAKRMFAKMAAEDPKVAAANKDNSLVTEPLADDLFVVYVIDSPEQTATLTSDKLAECGVKAAELHQVAFDNLRRKAAGFKLEAVQAMPGVSVVTGDNYYETALFALDDYWTAARFPFKGDIVVAMPARGWLLVADGSDRSAVDSLSRVAVKAFHNKAYALTPALYARHGGAWVRQHD